MALGEHAEGTTKFIFTSTGQPQKESDVNKNKEESLMMKYPIILYAIACTLQFFVFPEKYSNGLFAQGVWTPKTFFGGTGRKNAVGFSIGNYGYIGTGQDADSLRSDFWEYDPLYNFWTQKADFGGTAREKAVGFSIDSMGYIGTGKDIGGATNDFWEYNRMANTWTIKAPFSGAARLDAVGFSIGSKGYIGTGQIGSNADTKDFWEYDPALNNWTQKADFGGTAREQAVGFSIGTKGYIGTGDDVPGPGGFTKDFWEYTPGPGVMGGFWTLKAPFPGTAREEAIGFAVCARGYIGTGGQNGSNMNNDFWEWDQPTNVWTAQTSFGLTVRESAVGFSIGQKGYIGTGDDGGYTQDFWEYDPLSVTFSIASQNVSCNSQCTGSATVTPVKGINPFTFLWSDSAGQTTQTATGLCAGDYSITVTDSIGCFHSDTITINQPEMLAVNLFVADVSCNNNSDGSAWTVSSGGTSPYSYLWSHGGSSAAENNLAPGIYTVTLTDSNGCTAIDSGIVNKEPSPLATISGTAFVCPGDTVTLTASGGINYVWNTGATTGIISDLLDSAFSYIVTVTDANGCTDTAVHTVASYVLTAGFTFQNNCQGVPTVFSDNSSSGTAFWQWSFGDGFSSFQQNPAHTYAGSGVFIITQIVTSWQGCKDTLTDTVTVYPAPVADFEPDTVCLKDSTQFTDLSTISSGVIDSWTWIFNDGNPASFDQHPIHLFNLGTYNVQLIIESDKGCKDTLTKPVGVYPLPFAAFTYVNACLNEQPLQFYDSSSVSAGNTVISWQWNVGPGTSSASVPNPTWTFVSAGIYPVELIVTSDKGCVDTVQQEIEIYPAPIADFTADTTAGCESHCVDFTDQSFIADGTIATWDWDFGVSGTSSAALPNPAFCYENAGNYSVSLIVVSDKGCKDTLTKPSYITVFPLPSADFSFSPETATVQDMNIIFTDLSSGSIGEWAWAFFDNDSATIKGLSAQQHPHFNFASASTDPFLFFLGDTGYYPVQLIVTTVNGCKDTITKKVKIEGVFYVNIPNAFTPDGDGVNDYFFPKGVGIDPDKEFKFYVFDRWGDMIFESNSLERAWDGTYKGENVQQDVYVWLIEVMETTPEHPKHRYIGHVTVVR